MNERGAPSADRLDDVAWAMEQGHDFWSWVDSRSIHNGPLCRNGCDPEYGSDDCEAWAHQRNSKQCIAQNSARNRCNQWVMAATPFCRFHFARAWEALYFAADREQREQFEKFTADQRREMEAEVERLLALELQQLYDRTHAARQEYVYFFVAQHAVKVGRSVQPEVRVRTLSGTRCPDDVDHRSGELIGTIKGGSRVEHDLHRRFAAHRLAGEWFLYEPIAEDIASLLSSDTVRAA